jgi:LPXTG-motif cell wall-anchored protein
MDSVIITRIIAGVLAVLVLGFLIQRRRKSVR